MEIAQAGKLTDEQRRIVDAWVAKNWKQKFTCPICDSVNWVISEHLIDFKPYAGPFMLFGGLPSFPHVLITSECGYGIFINAIIMGVLKPDSRQTTPTESGPVA